MYSAYSLVIFSFNYHSFQFIFYVVIQIHMRYLRIQIQVCKLSFTDGCDCVTVHCEVHLSTIALDGDIVPV